MMKKKLIKMRVCLGFDCNPRLDIVSYEDEVAPDGRVYQSTKGIRNERTLVEFGQVWLKFDSASITPYWDAYVILDGDVSTDLSVIAEKAMDLHEQAINAMEGGMKEAMKRYEALKVPSLTSVEEILREKLNAGVKSSDGRFIVPVEEFKKLIAENAGKSGRQMAENNGFDLDKWDKFYSDTLTPEILTILMKGLPVLKFTGDGIEFQTKDMYQQALGAVSMKVSSDVFARFVETMATAK